jgi:hypothetical protein
VHCKSKIITALFAAVELSTYVFEQHQFNWIPENKMVTEI